MAGILRELSDSFREFAYSRGGYRVYTNVDRDEILLGFDRPKFFTSEPSLLAIGFFAFSNSWLLLSFSRKNWMIVCISTIIMLNLTGSPILLISLVASIVILISQIRYSRNSWYILLVATLIVYALTIGGVFDKVQDRLMHSLFETDISVVSSENLRMIFPYISMIDILKSSPFFGVGISGKELIGVYSSLPLDSSDAFGNNNLAAMFTYLGGLGGMLFIAVFYGYIGRIRISSKLIFIIMFIALTQMMGGFESPRFWGYIFLFIGVLRKAAEASTLIQQNKREQL